MDVPVGLGAGLLQSVEKEAPVGVIPEDVLPVIPTIHNVVDGPFILEA
jgi:hypothetical protein